MKVLLSAYACEPNRGSEPGVGWEWANTLSHMHSVTVITRANNKCVIEKWYEDNAKGADLDSQPTFLYYDPPACILWLKKRGLISVQLFYALWQLGVAWSFRNTVQSHDILHHVTFNSMMLPGCWWFTDTPTVLGPLGGTSCVSKEYLPIYGRKKWKENIRRTFVKNWALLPWVRFSFNQASAIYCANTETKNHIDREYSEKTHQMLETGVRIDQDAAPQNYVYTQCAETRFVWIGALEPWKAVDIALQAFAMMLRKSKHATDAHLDIVGSGSQIKIATAMASQLEIQDKVTFHGQIEKSKVNSLIRNSRGLIFSSIKDTSGNVVLEAMLQARAVICLNHQGVADITTDETALRVDPGNLQETISGFACAIQSLAEDSQLAEKLGKAGFQRVKNVYSWSIKAKAMDETYQQILHG